MEVDIDKNTNELVSLTDYLGGVSQEIALEFANREAMWIDSVFAANWPKLLVRFARWQNKRLAQKKAPNFLMRLGIFLMARYAKLNIERRRHYNQFNGKGFRNGGSIVLDRVNVKVKKGNKVVEEKDFKLQITVKK